MKTKPEVTDEEIRNFMNFDKLLSENNVIQLRRRNTSRRVWGGLAVVLVASLGTTSYWYSQNSPEEIVQPKEEKMTPIIPPKEEKQESKNQITQEKSGAKEASKNEIKSTVGREKSENKTILIMDSVIAKTSIYTEAEPIAGFPHLYEYFNAELTYPKEAVKDSIQGIVTVSFVINKEGKPEEVEIINSLGDPFDQEAHRLIERMPAWKPANMNGKPIRAKISLPLTFRLEKRK